MGACSTDFCGCKMYYVDQTVMENVELPRFALKIAPWKGKSSPKFGLVRSTQLWELRATKSLLKRRFVESSMNEPSNCLILIKFGRAVHFGLVIKAENKHRTSGLRCQCNANCHRFQYWPLNVWSVPYAMSESVRLSVHHTRKSRLNGST